MMVYPNSIITVGNQKFIVDGEYWLPVPISTTFDEARKLHTQKFPEVYHKKQVINSFKTYKVKSKSKNSMVSVKMFSDGKFECGCMGFFYRKNCRHVEEVRKKYGKK